MPELFPNPEAVMQQAIELARRGIGRVEPNPAVGAVIVDSHLNRIGGGYHQQFGMAHAEINAIADATPLPSDAVMYVTLEPCCHQGKTPPCTQAIINSGLRTVVVSRLDPSAHADGKGIEQLRSAGLSVQVGLLEAESRRLNAPFLKRITHCLPYIHAKWAMTLDGKIATRTGASQWISSEASRRVVHQLRGRMDAIIIGSGTAQADDPLLTARPAGPRVAMRVVLDSKARLSLESQLARTAHQVPVLLATSEYASVDRVARLETSGIEVLRFAASPTQHTDQDPHADRLPDPLAVLQELARRDMTNVLVEGGAEIFGSFFDQNLIDEVHVFIAPKLIGGRAAQTPVLGSGLECIPDADQLEELTVDTLDDNVYIHAFLCSCNAADVRATRPAIAKSH